MGRIKGVPGLGWDVEKIEPKKGKAKSTTPKLTPQQIRSIRQSPKGKLPPFLSNYA